MEACSPLAAYSMAASFDLQSGYQDKADIWNIRPAAAFCQRLQPAPTIFSLMREMSFLNCLSIAHLSQSPKNSASPNTMFCPPKLSKTEVRPRPIQHAAICTCVTTIFSLSRKLHPCLYAARTPPKSQYICHELAQGFCVQTVRPCVENPDRSM